MEKVKSQKIEKKNLIKNCFRDNAKAKEKPIIVIDVCSLIPASVFPDQGVTLCGGRHQFIVEKCTKFFNQLISLGAKLVFFTDGSLQEAKHFTWCHRQDGRYTNMLNILDDIYQEYKY